MTRYQLSKQLNLLLRDLGKVKKRMDKIADEIGVERNTDIQRMMNEVEELTRIGEQHASGTEN